MKNIPGIRGLLVVILVLIMVTGGLPRLHTSYGEAAGPVALNKVAVPSGLNEWDITLSMSGTVAQSRTSDIVLLIDKSDSMADDEKLTKAKKAAVEFVQQMLDENGKTRISIVSFNRLASVEADFTNISGLTTLVSKINSITSTLKNGGTNIQIALHTAQTLFESSSADLKSVILIGDGEPTNSQQIISIRNVTATCPAESHQAPIWNYADMEQTYSYTATMGDGEFYSLPSWNKISARVQCQISPNVYHVLKYPDDNGAPTLYEANLLKQNHINIYAIGIDVNNIGKYVLKGCQNKGYYEQSGETGDFDFSEMIWDLCSDTCDATVVDPIGEHFELTGDSAISQGYKVTYDPKSRVLKWLAGLIASEKPAVMTYKVKAKPGTVFEQGKTYQTNGQAVLNYIENGVAVSQEFPKPEVMLTGGAVSAIAVEVNTSGHPVGAGGTSVDLKDAVRLCTPQRVPQSGLVVYGDVQVSNNTIEGYEYKGYAVPSSGNQGAENCVSISLGPADRFPVVYFLYEKKSEYLQGGAGSGGGSGSGSSSANSTGETKSISSSVGGPELEKKEHFAYIIGYPDGLVRPIGTITREEVAVIFYRLLTKESRERYLSTSHRFHDVENNRWSNKEIATLAEAGILNGYPDGGFYPERPITRAEFAVLSAKFDLLENETQKSFPDVEHHWAKLYINSSASKGWINGYGDGTFRPDNTIIRCEAMKLINEILDRRVNLAGIHKDAVNWSDNPTDKWYYEIVMEATNTHDYEREPRPKSIETWTRIKENPVW